MGTTGYSDQMWNNQNPQRRQAAEEFQDQHFATARELSDRQLSKVVAPLQQQVCFRCTETAGYFPEGRHHFLRRDPGSSVSSRMDRAIPRRKLSYEKERRKKKFI
ncbi:unnamed protein product [Gongylonema pulchrum]|uniref:CACTA en-spm transposon protein n=1 Tax=Gongylonema pulchrum TaxID=637853 RepID=A0A183D2Y5_9BILA|nr:unnamed protein product [Gongylonema pulchrum]